jgi:hypothetical protein
MEVLIIVVVVVVLVLLGLAMAVRIINQIAQTTLPTTTSWPLSRRPASPSSTNLFSPRRTS